MSDMCAGVTVTQRERSLIDPRVLSQVVIEGEREKTKQRSNQADKLPEKSERDIKKPTA